MLLRALMSLLYVGCDFDSSSGGTSVGMVVVRMTMFTGVGDYRLSQSTPEWHGKSRELVMKIITTYTCTPQNAKNRATDEVPVPVGLASHQPMR